MHAFAKGAVGECRHGEGQRLAGVVHIGGGEYRAGRDGVGSHFGGHTRAGQAIAACWAEDRREIAQVGIDVDFHLFGGKDCAVVNAVERHVNKLTFQIGHSSGNGTLSLCTDSLTGNFFNLHHVGIGLIAFETYGAFISRSISTSRAQILAGRTAYYGEDIIVGVAAF